MRFAMVRITAISLAFLESLVISVHGYANAITYLYPLREIQFSL